MTCKRERKVVIFPELNLSTAFSALDHLLVRESVRFENCDTFVPEALNYLLKSFSFNATALVNLIEFGTCPEELTKQLADAQAVYEDRQSKRRTDALCG